MKRILFLKIVLVSFLLTLMSSCSVPDNKITGEWTYNTSNDVTSDVVLTLVINADHSGKYYCYVGSKPGRYESVIEGNFTWEKDGYLIKISGKYKELQNSGYSDNLTYDEDNFTSVTLRYTDGHLVMSSIPGISFSNTNISLTKK